MSLFTPITDSLEERKKIFNTKQITSEKILGLDLSDPLILRELASQLDEFAIENMKFFITENWKDLPIDAWNQAMFIFNDKWFGKSLKVKRFKALSIRANKITKLNFVYDESDGDLSFSVNSQKWRFLEDDEVNTFYNIIKEFKEK